MDALLRQLQSEIAKSIANMDPRRMSSAQQGRWSAAQILEHLYLSYTATSKGFDRVLAAGKPSAGAPSLQQRVGALLVLGMGYLPSGRKSPPSAEPRGLPAEQVIAEIGSQVAQMDEKIAGCEAKLGPKTRLLDHPVLGPLTGQQWRKFHWVHGMHHIRQLKRIAG
jgi:hypothetical protein